MKPLDVDAFFSQLSQTYKSKAEIVLIGGAAAAILGGTRPTQDVDFEVKLAKPSEWEIFQQAVIDTVKKTGIKAQFAEKVEQWSQITLLDYREQKRLYKKFNQITVWVLDPIYWSIGKIARYWDQDVQDILAVFKVAKPNAWEVAKVWKKALVKSPKSSLLFLVKNQIKHFFINHGKTVWGPNFDGAEIIKKLFDN